MQDTFSINMLIHKLLILSYQLLIFFSMLLPSGSIFHINIKFILFIVFFIIFFTYLVCENINIKLSYVISFLFIITLLLFWSLVFIINGFSDLSILSGELKDFFVTIVIVFISYFLLINNIIGFDDIIYTIVYAVFLLITISTLLIILIVYFGLSFESTFGFIKNLFDVYMMTFDITDNLKRVQLPNYIVIPFVVYFIFYSDELNIHFPHYIKYLFILFSLFVIFLTFSRFIWAATLVFIITALLCKRRIFILLLILLGFLILFYYEHSFLTGVIQSRFFSKAVELSDNIRTLQFDSLINSFYDHYLIGNGIGSYARDYVRGEKYPYSYELQWISFLMKFGVIGMVILLLYILLFLKLCLTNVNRHKGYLLIGITLYFLGGFTNPYLLTSYAACFYIFFMAICFKIKSEEKNDSISQVI
jgi:hypothetical protein